MNGARAISILGAVLAAAALAAPALAGEGFAAGRARLADPFSALVGKGGAPAAAAPVARFEVAADRRHFLLEGRVGPARMKFLCGENDPRIDCTLDPVAAAEEIFLATGVRGSRGDIIYRDADGETLLRLMPYGGATVSWPGRTQGEAASPTFGEDDALVLPPANHQDAVRRAARATQRLSAVAGSTILFDAGAPAMAAARIAAVPAPRAGATFVEAPAAADAALAAPAGPEARVLADAVVRAAAGMAAVANDATGARVLGERIGVVRFRPGAPPRVSLDGRTMTIIYDPAADAEGRPSSRAIAKFLENSL